ncbi:MAG: hypothetical protein IJS81_09245 [Selenomonadaceae bacterium]|nr:hypothetical protein [Selenomonadaceae bacterium]MBQ7630378.1 hypothetical protein [Selenomonadaceae bacterium]
MTSGTITRLINKVQEDLYAEFRDMYTVADFERKYEQLIACGNKSNRPSILAELYKMFKACGISFEKNKDNRYYGALIQNLSVTNQLDVSYKILRELYRRYSVYPSPKDYMTRIVDRLENNSDGWAENSLRLRILKRFIKYGDYLSDAGFKGGKYIQDYVKNKIGKKPTLEEILLQLDDGIFFALETADKAQKKPRGKFGILKLADDLAEGKFRVEGATKRGLYLFAMAYNMTYSPAENSPSFNPDTDLEKNLFRDYYTNNLMRFITDTYRGKSREFEADPSEQGINYKDFEEVIFLYFIAGNYSPAKKIKLSFEMIERVKINCRRVEKNSTSAEISETKFFRQRLIGENIFYLNAANFEKFVCENYGVDNVQSKSAQNTAFKSYKKILSDIEKKYSTDLKNCNYGLYFADVSAINTADLAEIIGENYDEKNCGEFLELLRVIHKFLGGFITDESIGSERRELSERKNKSLAVDESEKMTRTILITAYYYLYNCAHEDDERKNFVEFFKSFKVGADIFLQSAGYQLFSAKNFFDLAVAFSSYAYINS